MLLLTVVLMVSVSLGQTYPSGAYSSHSEDEGGVEEVLRALRGTGDLPGPPASRLSPHLLVNMGLPQLTSALPRRPWWWYLQKPHPEVKRRHDPASYNLNSFGLRYGK
ncbi:metastasis-suppressor KiSS-1 [Brachyhypopomus gauderio]|uniref:metastasis-suppressor KiSS-1 n=1 Tax=Brachyhypopomus gauderio TaxID=698409 RepID=UPI004042EB70